MKALIKHLLANNLEEIIEKSIMNCHCGGLHSIMLIDKPEQRIRLYVADVDHELWKNHMFEDLSLGYHPHHCDITIDCIHGDLQNIELIECDLESSRIQLKRWKYQSPILNNTSGFTQKGISGFRIGLISKLSKGKFIYVKALDIHSVYVPFDKSAAWFVYEGKENKNYVPYCWSNKNLEFHNNEGLYQKPTESDIIRLLTLAELL